MVVVAAHNVVLVVLVTNVTLSPFPGDQFVICPLFKEINNALCKWFCNRLYNALREPLCLSRGPFSALRFTHVCFRNAIKQLGWSRMETRLFEHSLLLLISQTTACLVLAKGPENASTVNNRLQDRKAALVRQSGWHRNYGLVESRAMITRSSASRGVHIPNILWKVSWSWKGLKVSGMCFHYCTENSNLVNDYDRTICAVTACA